MSDLEDIKGVGPARAESIEEAGYTLEGLADADHEILAEDIGVPEDTALEFVVQAQEMVGDEEEDEEETETEEEMPSVDDLEDAAEETEEAEEEPEEDEDEAEEEADAETRISLGMELNGRQRDLFTAMVIDGYIERGNVLAFEEALSTVIEQQRGVGTDLNLELTPNEINRLHAVVQSHIQQYQGANAIAWMEDAQEILAQINEARQDLF